MELQDKSEDHKLDADNSLADLSYSSAFATRFSSVLILGGNKTGKKTLLARIPDSSGNVPSILQVAEKASRRASQEMSNNTAAAQQTCPQNTNPIYWELGGTPRENTPRENTPYEYTSREYTPRENASTRELHSNLVPDTGDVFQDQMKFVTMYNSSVNIPQVSIRFHILEVKFDINEWYTQYSDDIEQKKQKLRNNMPITPRVNEQQNGTENKTSGFFTLVDENIKTINRRHQINICCILFDLTKYGGLSECEKWIKFIYYYMGSQLSVWIIGTRSDKWDRICVTAQEMQSICERYKANRMTMNILSDDHVKNFCKTMARVSVKQINMHLKKIGGSLPSTPGRTHKRSLTGGMYEDWVFVPFDHCYDKYLESAAHDDKIEGAQKHNRKNEIDSDTNIPDSNTNEYTDNFEGLPTINHKNKIWVILLRNLCCMSSDDISKSDSYYSTIHEDF